MNISGCFCNTGECTSCYQTLVTCGSLEGYCLSGKLGSPPVGLGCPYISDSPCNYDRCICAYSLGSSYNGQWSVSCFNYNGSVPLSNSTAAICSL
jgi:hypothetical protein